MNKTRDLTCIVCPRGCQITVTFGEDGKIASIEGNSCKRGYTYAETECTHPRRTVTTTVRCDDGAVVPVKTKDTVPKEKIFEVMREVNAVVAKAPLAIGDVVIEDAAGTGVPVVVCRNHEKNA